MCMDFFDISYKTDFNILWQCHPNTFCRRWFFFYNQQEQNYKILVKKITFVIMNDTKALCGDTVVMTMQFQSRSCEKHSSVSKENKYVPWLASLAWRLEPEGTRWINTITSPSFTPRAFNDFLSSSSGVPFKCRMISLAGKPDSISQKALKFSSSNSSDTCKTKSSSFKVVIVTFIVEFGWLLLWN